jgi:hypothetical protein
MGMLIAIGAGLALILLVYDWLFRAKSRKDIPTCGKCGYGVRGIPSLICPECGSDLREAGILVPFRLPNPGLRTFTHLLIWTLLVPLPVGYVLDLYAESLLPIRYEAMRSAAIHFNSPGFPKAIGAELDGSEDGLVNTTNPRLTRMSLFTTQIESNLIVDLPDGKAWFHQSANRAIVSSPRLDADIVAQWLTDAGFDPKSDPTSPERMNELMQILTAVIDYDVPTLRKFRPPAPIMIDTGRGTRFQPRLAARPATQQTVTVMAGTVSVFIQYTAWTYAFIVGIPAVMWLAGVYYLIRRLRWRSRAGPG